MDEQYWSLVSSRADFDKLRVDPSFRALVKLARAVNAVLFCQMVLLENVTDNDDTPAQQRKRLNAFLYLSAVLYEAVALAKGELGRHFRELEVFQSSFPPLFRDAQVDRLVEQVLKRLRNHGVFHFTDEAIPDGLQDLQQDAYVFACGYGAETGQVYYSLADEATFRAALGLKGTREEINTQLKQFIVETARLSQKFCDASNKLIAYVLAEPPWFIREDEPPTA